MPLCNQGCSSAVSRRTCAENGWHRGFGGRHTPRRLLCTSRRSATGGSAGVGFRHVIGRGGRKAPPVVHRSNLDVSRASRLAGCKRTVGRQKSKRQLPGWKWHLPSASCRHRAPAMQHSLTYVRIAGSAFHFTICANAHLVMALLCCHSTFSRSCGLLCTAACVLSWALQTICGEDATLLKSLARWGQAWRCSIYRPPHV